MAKNKVKKIERRKKKTSIGLSNFTKYGHAGSNGGGKRYKKKYRGQGR